MKRLAAVGIVLAFVSGIVAAVVSCAKPGDSPGNGVLSQLRQIPGQLFCAKPSQLGTVLVAAIADASGAPFIVNGLAAGVVAAACAKWAPDAVPVTPPATPVPTVAVLPKA